jgi:retinol dehydrogenase-12
VSETALRGLRVLVTGATSGIGLSAVEALVAGGAEVVLGARSADKARTVMTQLKARWPTAAIEWLQVDLADLQSVRRAAATFTASSRCLDVLINNAGVAGASGLTRDGFEITVGTNHLGPYLLTELLLPSLQLAPRARIVNVASRAHARVKHVDWERFEHPARSWREKLVQYWVSKLLNVLHAKELARRLAGTQVTTYALHPGVVASSLWRDLPAALNALTGLFMVSNEEGAKPLLYCATAPELAEVSGRYFHLCHEAAPNPLALDAQLASELFAWSERACQRVGV